LILVNGTLESGLRETFKFETLDEDGELSLISATFSLIMATDFPSKIEIETTNVAPSLRCNFTCPFWNLRIWASISVPERFFN
jgi:hypothetical protein